MLASQTRVKTVEPVYLGVMAIFYAHVLQDGAELPVMKVFKLKKL